MPIFDINNYCSQLFWLIIIFGILYFLIGKLISPIVEQILNNRSSSIEDDISNASNLTQKIAELKEEYNIKISNISSIITTIRKNALDKLELAFTSKKTKLHNELNTQVKQNLADIESVSKLIIINEEDACINLASFIITKITSDNIDLKLLKECYDKIK